MTTVVRLGIFLVAAIIALAENDDIFARLRQALGADGEVAATELHNKKFAQVERMLKTAHPTGASNRAELLSLQGAVAFLDGDIPRADADFAQARALAMLKDNDTFTWAMALVKLRNDDHARVLMQELARSHPTQAVYIYWLGRMDYDQRRYQEATGELETAVKLDPKSARAWDSLGLAFDMQGHMEQALGAFQKGTELNRALTHPSPWPPHNLGYLLLRKDQPKQAETALRESLRYDSQLAQTHYYLGRALEKEGDETAAASEYQIAVTNDAASPEPCYSLAILYRKLHRDADASALFAEFKKRKATLPPPDLKASDNN